MHDKKFKKLPELELRLLLTMGMLIEQRLAFKINSYPNYRISNYEGSGAE